MVLLMRSQSLRFDRSRNDLTLSPRCELMAARLGLKTLLEEVWVKFG